MEVGSGFSVSEAWRYMGRLFKDSEASAHGTPDIGVGVKLDGDVSCLRDLPLILHTDREEVGGYVDPETLGAFVCGVSVQGGLP